MTLDIAHRVLADSTSGDDRLDWAHDAVSALEHGDISAARRIGLLVAPCQSHPPSSLTLPSAAMPQVAIPVDDAPVWATDDAGLSSEVVQ